MIKILDAFWRAFAYALTPRVLVLTMMPLFVLVALVMTLAYFYLASAQAWVVQALQTWPWLEAGFTWMAGMGFAALQTVLGSLTPEQLAEVNRLVANATAASEAQRAQAAAELAAVQEEYLRLATALWEGTPALESATLPDREIFDLLGFD